MPPGRTAQGWGWALPWETARRRGRARGTDGGERGAEGWGCGWAVGGGEEERRDQRDGHGDVPPMAQGRAVEGR